MEFQDDLGTKTNEWTSIDVPQHQTVPRGTALGRYIIIEPIGSGGMGAVYRAFDPELNRGVALKILSVKQEDPQAAERAKSRLLREAQALAQLSHPNVVAVHDVGTLEQDVFIAMELVRGKTLKEWLDEGKKPIKEILQVMIAAGRGLWAAHQADLVHRDFKPGNVIVGDDGRVRVLDFGLARVVSDQDSFEEESQEPDRVCNSSDPKESTVALEPTDLSSSSAPSLLLSPITIAGGIVGTPLYMSPEQHLGQHTDARTDQFAFCLVLYEALYGHRPYRAKTLETLKEKVLGQKISAPPAHTKVPAWLFECVQQGLKADPQERFRSMEVLLDKITFDPEEADRKRRALQMRILLMAMLIVFAIALPMGVWYGLRDRTVQHCKDSQTQLLGVWDNASQRAVETAFLGTQKSFAKGTWKRVKEFFDQHLAAWTKMKSEVCEARLLHATQSEELFDLRMSCLQKRIDELNALVKVFRQADAKVVQKAVQASASLTELALCADEKALRAPYPPPQDAEKINKVAAIRYQLTEVQALHKTGKYQEGLEVAKKLEQQAMALDYRPVRAEVLYWLGSLLDRTGQYKQAETSLQQAARLAGQSRDALLAGRAMILLVPVVGYQQAKHEKGLALGQAAGVLLDVAGGDPRSRSRLLNAMGIVSWLHDQIDRALVYYRQSLAIWENTPGSEHLVVSTLHNTGLLYSSIGEFDQALAYYQRSANIKEKVLGADHPNLAITLNNMGFVHWKKTEHSQALAYFQKALSIYENALGPQHPDTARALSNMGLIFGEQGDHQKALSYQRKSLSMREKALGPDHPFVAWSLFGIGKALLDLHRPEQALAPLKRVITLCKKKKCEPDPHGRALFNLGRALLVTAKDHAQAIKLAQEAQIVFGKTPKRFTHETKTVQAWIKRIARGSPTH